jgi:rifampin ADP-ribosylating transferase
MERVIADSGRVPVRVWKGVLDAMMASVPDDSAIRCPTLVLGGRQDAVFSPAEQEAMTRQIRGAVVKIFPDIGHDLQWEDPDLFVREFNS